MTLWIKTLLNRMFGAPDSKHSITNTLLACIISSLIMTAVLVLSINFLLSQEKAGQELQMSLEEYGDALKEVLSVPLWMYDRETIGVIGKTYLLNQSVIEISIKNKKGDVLFHSKKQKGSPDISGTYDIFYADKPIGLVRISMSLEYYKAIQMSLFRSNSIMILVMISILFFVIIVLLQRLIRNPIQRFIKMTDAFAAGSRNAFDEHVAYVEFQPLIHVLKAMGDKITLQMQSIREMNRDLEERVHLRTSELYETNVQLKEAKEAAESANQSKSIFLANMSHELRSPLTAILGFARVMTRSSTFPKEHLENAGIIIRSGEHLLTLINQVLDLSKIEAGRTTLNENSFDLHSLLDDTEDMFRMRAEDRHLQLTFERTPDVPQYVKTDEVKLRQVLINLLNNAVKFTTEGGIVVRVRGEITEESLLTSHFSLHFEVEDTGPGIAPDELDRLFEAFAQTKTGRQSQEGTGLGLAISRKFVHLMGGDMTVKSEPGRGSVFSFSIRAEKAESADVRMIQTDRHVIALEPGQPRYRILIVDDNAINRQLLVKLLNPFGFEIREAENGRKAVETWEQWEPHLIWMDMRMPVMNGYEATGKIKETVKGQATVVIALTASAFEEEKSLVMSAGCDDFLRKPYKEAVIFEAMEKHLGIRFIREEDAPEPKHKPTDEKLVSDAVKALPRQLLTELEQASVRGDTMAVESLIGQIRPLDAPLADFLKTLADNFDYDQILELVKS